MNCKTTIAKPRSDAWDAPLTEEQRWAAYARFRANPWYDVAKWAVEEFGVPAPSRTAMYRWADRMRSMESAHRVEQAVLARAEAGDLAEVAAQDEVMIEGYKSLAADMAMRTGDTKKALEFLKMAMDLSLRREARAEGERKDRELALKRAAQATKEDQLKLAREKFEAAEARLAAARAAVARLNQAGGLTAEARSEIEKAMGIL
jgi:hypothetical protein